MILFKEDGYYYHITKYDTLSIDTIDDQEDIDMLEDVQHLDDAKPIYHYKDTEDGAVFPVYYEYGDRFITFVTLYDTMKIKNSFNKDYTLVNLKLLENENNI